MGIYRGLGERMLSKFERVSIEQIERSKNAKADAIARLATSQDAAQLGMVLITRVSVPSTNLMDIDQGCAPKSWMTEIIDYLKGGQSRGTSTQSKPCVLESELLDT